jgi:hypothetical protein
MLVPGGQKSALEDKARKQLHLSGDVETSAAATENAPATSSSTSSSSRSTGMVPGSAVTGTRKRLTTPDIDYDAKIQEAAALIKNMSKAMAAAKSAQKNERRKKQRLLKKAACLSSEDLERIAVLKRCGLWTGHPPTQSEHPELFTTAANQESKDMEVSATSASSVPGCMSTSDGVVSHPEKNLEADDQEQDDDEMPGKD